MTRTYSPPRAWGLGVGYFALCGLIGWFSGALPWVLAQPLIRPAQRADLLWWGLLIASLLILSLGYYVVWPRGTLTHGRPLQTAAVLIFGGLWGLSEGMLFLSVWTLLRGWITADWLLISATFAALAAFKGLWHSLFWDIYVAPDHNIEAWNLRKVLLAHVPNLAITLTFLTVYENGGLFVLLQSYALLGSAYFMRFPGFWSAR